MRRNHLFGLFGLMFTLSATTTLQGAGATVEFSAETYQKDPKQGESSGHIFVGKESVRTETIQNGQQIIQIIDTAKKVTRVIYPAQKSYLEYPGSGGPMPTSDGNPCANLPGAECKRLGEEDIQGRAAVKWQVNIKMQGQVMSSTQWLDSERHIMLRQETPNGQVMEQRMLGSETLDGRSVEKWEMTISQPGKSPQRSLRLYDPELKLAVREEYPGGFVRELRNIRLGAQDARLFTVPPGFKKVTPQRGGPQRR